MAPDSKAELVIVSGLPRSGTSMMMRMLSAGGMEMVADHFRSADEDNPLGYFEDERVKTLADDNSWITSELDGKVLKAISMLLYHLPSPLNYKVVFLLRNIDEVLASQRKMLSRRGEKYLGPDDSVMAAKFEEHLGKVRKWLDDQSHIETMYVDYAAVIESPREYAERVREFLGRDLDVDAMAGAVVPSMYRNRSD